MKINLCQKTVREFFYYDPCLGVLFWKDVGRCGVTAGSVAGCLDSRGYRVIRLYGRHWKAHRLIWLYVTGKMPSGVIDHINGDKSDNRFSNIRDVTVQQNLRNMPLQKNNRSGLPGVRWDKAMSKWVAYIKVEGIRRHLGSFDDFFCAASARKSEEVRVGFHINHGRTT